MAEGVPENRADKTFAKAPGRIGVPITSRLLPMVLAYWFVTALALVGFASASGGSVITENDDVMRLVEVRDLLAGQGWFDLMQYRLGLAGGTLMHWSRLIDLPIAALIRLFSLFAGQARAEELAAFAWPILLVPFLLLPLALAARRAGGTATMHIALGLGALFVFSSIRFAPGSFDHHNVQLALAMWLAAALTDPDRRLASSAGAGFVCALAIAIGAETTPLVAAACIRVAAQWIWHGAAFSKAAQAFGLSLTISITAFFVATVPPHAYAIVTCDNLSLGFYALSALGGTALFLLAKLPGTGKFRIRIVLAGVTGAILLLAARAIAPQCLGDPLGSLDPMLVDLWLRGVSEARSFIAEAVQEPEMIGGFYAVGLFAVFVCLFRAIRREEIEFHLVLLGLIGASWAVSLVQVRGAFFANLLSILPLSLLICDLRRAAAKNPESSRAALGYIGGVLASVPIVWAVAGVAVVHGVSKGFDLNAAARGSLGKEAGECGGLADMAVLNGIDKGVVAAPSNSGPEILRATQHRVLSGPYHRDQQGMLTELYIGLAQPDEANAFLHGAGVTVVAFCASDPQTQMLAKMKPDGLYAGLARNEIPDYLQPVSGEGNGFRFYRVAPPEK
ncbi:hypothetical protein KX729_18570 [Rhizobium sp. XQZ8]|uniref:hypothetical protein n=2 Tax=Rhizobium populisoli TaxID=2859785 RepID=UPI001CA50F65|nr:hypothetical protein [Rhizobium populisoli]MBW6423465.1 hypothetical protein [Rhizobium populisoli]